MYGIVCASVNKEDIEENGQLNYINFNDKNLYNAIKQFYLEYVKGYSSYDDTNMVLKLSDNLIEKIVSIDLSNKEISDISGLEKFKRIVELNLSNNNISDISLLSNLDILGTELNISNNNITKLPIIGCCKEDGERIIEKLDLSGNPIKDGLQNLQEIKITELKLNNCDLTDTDLEKLKNLQANYNNRIDIELSGNNLVNVAQLGEINKLGKLDLSGNKNIQIETIPKSINELILQNCELTDVSVFGEFENVGKLDLSGNKNIQIETIPKSINELILQNCELTDVSVFGEFEKIEKLDLSGNKNIQIETIPKGLSHINNGVGAKRRYK